MLSQRNRAGAGIILAMLLAPMPAGRHVDTRRGRFYRKMAGFSGFAGSSGTKTPDRQNDTPDRQGPIGAIQSG